MATSEGLLGEPVEEVVDIIASVDEFCLDEVVLLSQESLRLFVLRH